MNTSGQHLLVEFIDCDRLILDDMSRIRELLIEAASLAKTVVVATVFHPFTPSGVTGVVVLEESHLSIHTWPEHGYAAVDFFTCGNGQPECARKFLDQALRAQRSESILVKRGLNSSPTIKVEKCQRWSYEENVASQ